MAKRDEFIDRIRDERFLRKKPVIPPAYKLTAIEVRAPIVNDQISRLVGNLTANPQTITVPAPKPGPVGQQFSSKLEKGVHALHERLNEDAGENHEDLYMDRAVETGEGIIKITYRPDRWDAIPTEAEKNDIDKILDDDDGDALDSDEDFARFLKSRENWKKTNRLPIARRIVDRRNIYYWPDEDGIAKLIEVSERPLDDVLASFDDKWMPTVSTPIPFDADSGGRKVTLVEYWDRKWCVVVLIDGIGSISAGGNSNTPIILRRFEHGYNRVPYFTGFGEQTSSDDPNYRGLPSAFPIIYLAPFLNSLYTMWANIGYLVGFPMLKQTSKDVAGSTNFENEDSDEQSEPTPISPGEIVELPPGVDLEPLQYGPNASALTGMVAEVRNLIQSAMLPSIMQGVPPGSRTAGYAISELAAAAKSKYQSIVRNAESAWSQAHNFCLWLVEHKIQEPIYLMSTFSNDKDGTKYRDYLELRPKDINGYYMVKVKIQPRNAIDRIQEATFLANMHTAGAASIREVIEKGRGEEQPDEILAEIDVERALQSPEIQQFMQEMALRKAGLKPMLEEMAAASQMFQQEMQETRGAMKNGMPGSAGQPGGIQSPGAPVNQAPNSPAMNAPGMPNFAGQGQALTNPSAMPQLPRQYQPAGSSSRSRVPNSRPTPASPTRPGVEGFRSR